MGKLFYEPSLDRAYDASTDVHAAQQLNELLAADWLHDEVENGTVTVAMIRPSLDGSTIEPWADNEAASAIESNIENLGVLAKFAVRFSAELADEFYEGPAKDLQLTLEPIRYAAFSSRWWEFIDLMTKGKTTVLLLHEPKGEAIETWREQVGHYDIEGRRDPRNLRGKYGRDNYNNLIHGSDSPESVQRELGILRRVLAQSLRTTSDIHRGLPEVGAPSSFVLGADTLEAIGVADPQQIKVLGPWKPSSEVYHIDIQADYPDCSERLIVKSCIKSLPSCVVEDWIGRRRKIAEAGLTTPELKWYGAGSLVEEHIPFSLREAYKIGNDATRAQLKHSFMSMYEKVWNLGFRPVSFHDVRSHGIDTVLVDFGEDLGGIFPSAGSQVFDHAKAEVEFKSLIW